MPAVLFSRLQAEMVKLYNPPHRRKSTQAKLKKVLGEFAALPTVRRTSDITPAAVVDWLEAHSGRKPITNHSYLCSFRAACTYAKKMGYLRVSPWDVRRDWIDFEEGEDCDDAPARRHHPIDDILRLLDQLDAEAIRGDWCAGRLQALGYTYAYTGMRKMEALGLRVADVLLEDGLIRIASRRRRRLKTKKSAGMIGIPAELRVVLRRWAPRTGSPWLFPGKRGAAPWTGGSPGKKPLDELKAAAGRAGVPGLTILSLRHSIATHARRMGLKDLEIRDLLRHTTVKTQEHYQEDDLDNIRAAAGRISFRQFARVAS